MACNFLRQTKEETNMGILSETIVFVAGGAAGYALCYNIHTAKIDEKSTSSQDLTTIEQKYSTINSPERVIGPKDISIDYLVSQPNNFRGFIFTDNNTAQKSVLAKVQVYGSLQQTLMYVALDKELTPTQIVPIIQQGKIYSSPSCPPGQTDWKKKIKDLLE